MTFAAGYLTLGTIAILLSRAPEGLTKILLVPILIGAAGSLVATVVTYYLTIFALGRTRIVEVLWDREAVYTEAERLIREIIDSKGLVSRNVQVTTLSRRESPRDIPEVSTYMEAIEQLLESVENHGGNVYYKIMGKFGDFKHIQGQLEGKDEPRFVPHTEEIRDRLEHFSKKARRRIRIASFDEVWPVDILVVRGRIIIGFRGHHDGEMRWGLRIRSKELANRAEQWLEELWNDPKTQRVWDGKRVMEQ
jgi:hypothetical protein